MSVAQRRRISTLILSRFARTLMSRASGGPVALSRLWPGRTDRLIIAPHDLRTADATRAAEIYAGRFVFAGKIVTADGDLRTLPCHLPHRDPRLGGLDGFYSARLVRRT